MSAFTSCTRPQKQKKNFVLHLTSISSAMQTDYCTILQTSTKVCSFLRLTKGKVGEKLSSQIPTRTWSLTQCSRRKAGGTIWRAALCSKGSPGLGLLTGSIFGSSRKSFHAALVLTALTAVNEVSAYAINRNSYSLNIALSSLQPNHSFAP